MMKAGVAKKSIEFTHTVVRLKPVSGAVAMALGTLTLAGTAAAAVPPPIYDDEMIVSATRRDANVQDVPFNIAALSGNVLESQRLTDLNSVATWVPGLTNTDQGNRSANILTVRGLTSSSINAPELIGNNGGGTVTTYVGEIPIWVDLKTYDMERVEVLIGPQGTLFGASTLGGAVRYVPMPVDLNNTSIRTNVNGYVQKESSDLGYGGDLTFNLPIIEDVLGFRGLIAYQQDPGYIDYNYLVRNAGVSNPEPDFNNPADIDNNLISAKDVNDEETFNLRAQLRWDISETLTSRLRYDYQKQDVGGRNAVHTESFDTGDYESGHRFVEPKEQENHIVEFSFEWDFGFAELQSATGYVLYKEDGSRDQTDFQLNLNSQFATYSYGDFPAFASFTRDEDEQDTLSQEVRLVSNSDGPLNWLVGGFWSNFHQDSESREFLPNFSQWCQLPGNPSPICGFIPAAVPNDLNFERIRRDNQKEYALFGEVGWQITERWQTTVGARAYKYKINTREIENLYFFGDTDNPFNEAPETKDDGIIGKFNTSLDLDSLIPGMTSGTTYFTISQGYRVGGTNGTRPCGDPDNPQPGEICLLPSEVFYAPDETVNYELGIKSTWLEDRLLFNLSGFYVDWQDIQIGTTSAFGSIPITDNASDARSIGVELQSSLSFLERFILSGSYAYTNAELTEDAPGSVGVRGFTSVDAFDGDRLPSTPEHQGSLNLNFNQPLTNELTLDIDYGFVAQSNVYTKIGLRGSGEKLPGFAVHHLSAAFSVAQWSVRLFIDNLFDEYARTGVRNDPDWIDKREDGNGIGAESFTLRRYFYNVTRPRTAGVAIRYDFDL